jgi:hypothetical protein
MGVNITHQFPTHGPLHRGKGTYGVALTKH